MLNSNHDYSLSENFLFFCSHINIRSHIPMVQATRNNDILQKILKYLHLNKRTRKRRKFVHERADCVIVMNNASYKTLGLMNIS